MAQSNEFMDYILNRSTEYTEQGQVIIYKQKSISEYTELNYFSYEQSWKYAIIQTLASAPDASRVFGDYYAQLTVYIRQGAHYRPLQAAAAVENS